MAAGIEYGDAEQALKLLDDLCAGAVEMRESAWWRMAGDDLLAVGRNLELLSRLVYAAQVHWVGEVEKVSLAERHSCSSTAALLRQVLNISAADAKARVAAARDVLPVEPISGGELPPRLPVLAAALEAGDLSPRHISTVGETMRKLPDKVDPATRDVIETQLVDVAKMVDPVQFGKTADHILEMVDPDGTLNEKDPVERAEFTIGCRSRATGLTPIAGKLDDHGIAILRKSIDGLSAPRVEPDGTPDPRPATTRRAHALVEALSRSLRDGTLPAHGGVKPHITLILDWDLLQDKAGVAVTDDGQPLSPAQLRRLLCDAEVLPMVVNGAGRVLDVGRRRYTFPTAIRAAITARDKGCAFPACDRPPAWTECHHIRWWDRDLGPTSVDNGILLCSLHHHRIHQGDWTIRLAEDGIPEFIPPPWIDPEQRPRRNTVHTIIIDQLLDQAGR